MSTHQHPGQLPQISHLQKMALQLGFQQLSICDTDLSAYETGFLNWLDKDYHGEMHYMSRHGTKRTRPAELEPGTIRVISVRMDYFPPDSKSIQKVLNNQTLGLISRYATGRDYHKLIRKRLQKLVDKMQQEIGPFGYRVFTDSAPVLEKPLAEKAGLGWIGKHTNLINRSAGSWFFLGEIYTDLPLPVNAINGTHTAVNGTDTLNHLPVNGVNEAHNEELTEELTGHTPKTPTPKFYDEINGEINGKINGTHTLNHPTNHVESHCGSCTACIDICPTQAIVAPYELDARRCISYLTIELKSAIPVEFRKAMGNHIYGCDDCQLVCPWNRFSKASDEQDFEVRHGLDEPDLLDLFAWNEDEFLRKMEGSAIRRIGYMQWIRNIAVAIGNITPESAEHYQLLVTTLRHKRADVTPLVQEHIDWALQEIGNAWGKSE